ncbi:hypothetical protein MMC10_005296 [Thelotrema lepadinum]|nr:hypothetical protein [Thelotrema lepadinum]
MISRLLQSATTTFTQHGATRPQAPLESITEEAHTRDLLFPELIAPGLSQFNGLPSFAGRVLATPKDAASYDDHGGLDVASSDDVRIILAQDADHHYQSPQVLFDSRTPTRSKSQYGEHMEEPGLSSQQQFTLRGNFMNGQRPPTSRKAHTPNVSSCSSAQPIPVSPLSPRSSEYRFRGAFGETRSPRQPPLDSAHNDVEALRLKAAKDEKEDTDAILGCVFGAAGFRLEDSTKLHVIPRRVPEFTSLERKYSDTFRPTSPNGALRKRTPLFRSMSDAGKVFTRANNDDNEERAIPPARPAIMFTRLFSINLPDSASDVKHSSHVPSGANTDQAMEHPIDKALPSAKSDAATSTVSQKKAPMYAVTVVLQLPGDSSPPELRSQKSQTGLSTSYSSFNGSVLLSPQQAGNHNLSRTSDAAVGPIFDPTLKANVAYVLAHWRIISRSMELLEVAAREKLLEILAAIPITTMMSPPPARKGSRKPKTPKRPTQQKIHVLPECLQSLSVIQKEASVMAQTIVSGMRARRVYTGQDRWGAWKEEARWVSRWAGNRDQNFFFYNFLTAFLGAHTAWLHSLSPPWYRRRSEARRRCHATDNNCITQRTVIIGSDKMAARRLLFLLAAFLPSSRPGLALQLPMLPQVDRSALKKPTTTHAGISQSLERSAPGLHQVQSKTVKGSGHGRSVSFSVLENDKRRNHVPPTIQDRRGSESTSVKVSSLTNDKEAKGLRKASTSTVLADSDLPIPHITSPSMTVASPSMTSKRRESGSSLASASLTHNLQRSESMLSSSNSSSSHWNSVVGGFWNVRNTSSTDATESRFPASSPSMRRPSKLAQMVTEIESIDDDAEPSRRGSFFQMNSRTRPSDRSFQKPHSSGETSSARNIPFRPRVERMPLKLSFSEEDGYLDVSLSPSDSWNSSLASSFTSLRMPVLTSSSSLDSREHYAGHEMLLPESGLQHSGPTVEVAGWLKSYQPSFELQAVRPYNSLIDEIKASMYADSKLALPADHQAGSAEGEWQDVCTALVANTTTFTIERLRLLKRKKASSFNSPSVPETTPGDSIIYKEKLITEPVMEMDAILTDAVERLLSQSGGSSRTHSRAPSPKPAPQPFGSVRNTNVRRTPSSIVTEGGASLRHHRLDHPNTMNTWTSDCEKVLKGALQDVVRSVLEEKEQDPSENGRSHRYREPNSALREGTRKWLADLE